MGQIFTEKTIMDNLRKMLGWFSKNQIKDYFENVAYGLRVNGITDKNEIEEACGYLLNKWRFGMR
jgi:phosphate transport system ATP-binding protein